MTDPHTPEPRPTGTPNLNKALAAFQAEIPPLERDRSVEVETKGDKPNYSYSYATLANVTRAAMPLLGKHGLSFTAFPGTGPDGKFALSYALLHESGEERTGTFPLSAEGGIQVLGGRITYARRYCFVAVTGLAADEDDDAAHAQAQDESNAKTAHVGNRTARPAGTRQSTRTAAAQRPARNQGPPLPGEMADGETLTPGASSTGLPAGDAIRGRGGLITEPMTRKLVVSMNQVLGTDSATHRQFITDMIGREVASRKDLTFDEGRGLIDAFEKAQKDENPVAVVIDIYRRTSGEQATAAAPRAQRQRPAAEPRSRREQIVGRPAGPDDEPPPWENEPPAEWPETAEPGGGR